MIRRLIAVGIASILFSLVPIKSVYADYPLIRYTMSSRDPLYSQQQQDVEAWYSSGQGAFGLNIYSYVPRATEDIFAVAAAFNLPYDALATLNGWDSPGLLTPGRQILIPNMPGLFVPTEPSGPWESDLSDHQRSSEPIAVLVGMPTGATKSYEFFPGEKFTSDERIRFLGHVFSAPLQNSRISSNFGYRTNPFRGGLSFHPGVDLKADVGTEVYAARGGTVEKIGSLELYGLFVILRHDGQYQTVYAHLDEFLVREGQTVGAGDRIALSGNTGISTGPHLHFEIRKDGIPADPSTLTSFYD
ncbi:MAG: M23 family metallopeptidase [Spirochaetaceae bacterium]|nr:M23 family metallopeptidase [Spirochaetaceae bacterium]